MEIEKEALKKKWLTATALSCLVFPGLGQLTLGRKKAGITFMILSACSLFALGFSVIKFFLWYFSHLTPELEKFSELSSSLEHLLIPASAFVLLGMLWATNVIHIFKCKPH